ncbi:corticotropin-releasing factor receptor 2-like [Limulus polyphemus]|uniref:Corticotropin-releasing factor receptor 2-like n=1 Tax=Limulus polyphemus TaxID=6850 RepID=A0ABM1BTR2_LIMPO|nr:corticotropin-releasing factor receptor 2-like [Limulus polyphemus]
MNVSRELSLKETASVLCQLKYENAVYTEVGLEINRPLINSAIDKWDYIIVEFMQFSFSAHAYRICNESGDWLWGNWTNYTECLQLLRQDWLCKSILTLKMYAAMASINWMFVEGLLLHSRITISIFNKDAPFKLYHFIGWGFPLVFVVSWASIMSQFLDSPCWKGYGKTNYIWLVTGPMITALLINTVFLINVVRILVTKLRMSVSIETIQVRKAIKATALLFPLLGITHLLFCINPRDDSHLERAYMITNAVLQSSQGIFVAVLYCFMNSEVQTVVRNAYLRAMLRRNPNHCLLRGRGLSHTSATYLSKSDNTVSDTIRHKMSPSADIMVPLHNVFLPEEYFGRKKFKAPEANSDSERVRCSGAATYLQ